MSKAFTKESDGEFEEALPEPSDPLPPGVKNYVTPEGAEKLRDELRRWLEVIRPKAAEAKGKPGEPASRRRRLEAIDRRIHFLQDRVASMVVVRATEPDELCVRFGASVTVRDRDGNEKSYRIVGVDESDPAAGRVSFLSPIAKALISAGVGDVVSLKLPDGETELEVLGIVYR